ncbi:DNA polymerase III subunit beta [Tsuneonella sp. HG094]
MITVERTQFTKALQLAGSVIERRTTIPVLAAVKISANGVLRIEGSDLDTTAEASIEYEGEALDGISLLDPTRVRAAIDRSGGAKVAFSVDENRLAVKSGSLAASLSTLPADDHPGADRIADERFSATLGARELAEIERISAAISTEETRYYLNGVCVHRIGDWLFRFAATDGHRLMQVDVPLPDADGELPAGTIIPRRFLERVQKHLAKAKDGVRLSFGGVRIGNGADKTLAPGTVGSPRIAIAGQVGSVTLAISSKLIDGTYPDYSRVVPGAPKYHARLSKAALVQAVQSLTALASEKTRAVKLTAGKKSIVVSLRSPDLGEGTFPVPAEHNLPKDFEIGFNGQYLIDCLNALDGDEVAMGLDDASAPARIEDPADTAFLSVLMPMRV